MKPQFLSIPQPCSEDWNQMSATEQGAYCAKCTKEVLDCSDLKPNEIRSKVNQVENPCIRIHQPQIDEVNFLEWFEHLSLRKQLKYAFLFAFVLVFGRSTNTFAQNNTLIQPQFVEIDSADHLTKEERMADYEMVEEEKVARFKISDYIQEPCIWEIETRYTIETGQTLGFAVTGNVITIPEAIKPPSFFPGRFEEEEEIVPTTPYLQLNGNNYTFSVINDQLIFHANGRQETTVLLTIRKKDADAKIYTDPIQIKKGQGTLEFSTNGMENGIYIITIRDQEEEKSIQMPFW
jgi:hypothetical protein